MKLIPLTVEEALEYAPKAVLLDFDGPITPDLINALREHLSFAISALSVVSSKLHEAEDAIVDLHSSNLELAELLHQAAQPAVNPTPLTKRQAKQLKEKFESNGGIDPEYGRQLPIDDRFDDVPSREQIEVIEAPKTLYDGNTGKIYDLLDGAWVERLPPGATTVEFRTDPGTYDANSGEIHRMLAEEIVAQFGNKSGDDTTLPPGQS